MVEEPEQKRSGAVAEERERTAEVAETKRPRRTKSAVEALIKRAGRTPPDWWDSVELKCPRTLRIDWPQPKKGEKWTPSKYPGQYVISVINPNEFGAATKDRPWLVRRAAHVHRPKHQERARTLKTESRTSDMRGPPPIDTVHFGSIT